jgi:hypothetical protein
MEIKNLFSKEAQNTYSTVYEWIKKKVKPLTDVWTELYNKNVEAIQPAVSQIKDTFNTGFVEPIMKPIQKQQKIGKINDFLSKKWVTVEHIKALAEMDWSNADEILACLKWMGKKVQGMEEIQPNQVEQLQPQPEWLADQFKMQSSEEFWLMEWAKDIGKFFVNLPADSAEVVW